MQHRASHDTARGQVGNHLNHLAHATLAGPSSVDIAANLMGDFVRGRLEHRFPPRLEAGLRLHRAVDAFSDGHAVHRRSRRRLEPPFRRFGGILVDMYFDHFLARHFETLRGRPLTAFTREVYEALEEHRDWLPPRLRALLPHWRRDDLLAGYADMEVLERALAGLSRRPSRENPLAEGTDPLRAQYRAFEADFLAFFPEAQAFATAERRRLARTLLPPRQ